MKLENDLPVVRSVAAIGALIENAALFDRSEVFPSTRMRADLALLNTAPSIDIDNAKKIPAVTKAGAVIYRDELARAGVNSK